MRLRLERSRALQVGLLLLLGVSFAQILWWILDESHFTRRVITREEELLGDDARSARALLHMGIAEDRVAALWPRLVIENGTARVGDDALDALHSERKHRLNRYGWEGTFFLVVILAGMGILGQALKREIELKRRQQNFLAAVSHEFKSPIASLRLSAETLALRDPPSQRRHALIHRMLEDLQRLEAMVRNILDTTRIEEGRIPYAPERVDLCRLAASTAGEMREAAESQGVTITNTIPQGLAIRADPAAVQTVLRNLLDNAIKATQAAGGGTVTLHAARRDDRVAVEVSDTGIGIAAREIERIFEKFYRPGDEMRRRSRGSGLGLYLVRRFVELGGGSVRARSDGAGKGAVLTVTWPAAGENGP